MKLRTKKSHLQNLPEGKPPQRVLPLVVKYIYFLILAAVVGGIAYLIISRFVYFSGSGQVVLEKVVLSSKHGGVVQQLTAQAGSRCAAGDILAVIDHSRDCLEQEPDIRLTRLAYEIKEQEARQRVYTARIAELDKEQDTAILPRALEIGDARSRRRLESVMDELERVRQRSELLRAELHVKKEELAALKRELDVEVDASCGQETVRAPYDGTVYLVTQGLHEYVAQGDPLVILTPTAAEVFIEAYFAPKLLAYLARGRVLDITFPDRSTSRGIVVGLGSSADIAVERERESYRPREAGLRVLLKPETAAESERWREFERMDVKLKGRRI